MNVLPALFLILGISSSFCGEPSPGGVNGSKGRIKKKVESTCSSSENLRSGSSPDTPTYGSKDNVGNTQSGRVAKTKASLEGIPYDVEGSAKSSAIFSAKNDVVKYLELGWNVAANFVLDNSPQFVKDAAIATANFAIDKAHVLRDTATTAGSCIRSRCRYICGSRDLSEHEKHMKDFKMLLETFNSEIAKTQKLMDETELSMKRARLTMRKCDNLYRRLRNSKKKEIDGIIKEMEDLKEAMNSLQESSDVNKTLDEPLVWTPENGQNDPHGGNNGGHTGILINPKKGDEIQLVWAPQDYNPSSPSGVNANVAKQNEQRPSDRRRQPEDGMNGRLEGANGLSTESGDKGVTIGKKEEPSKPSMNDYNAPEVTMDDYNGHSDSLDGRHYDPLNAPTTPSGCLGVTKENDISLKEDVSSQLSIPTPITLFSGKEPLHAWNGKGEKVTEPMDLLAEAESTDGSSSESEDADYDGKESNKFIHDDATEMNKFVYQAAQESDSQKMSVSIDSTAHDSQVLTFPDPVVHDPQKISLSVAYGSLENPESLAPDTMVSGITL